MLIPLQVIPINFLPNLSQTLPTVPLPIKGSNTNSNSLDGSGTDPSKIMTKVFYTILSK